MKQSILKITRAIMPVAAFALTITSCNKTQTTPVNSCLTDAKATLTFNYCCQPIPGVLQVPEGNRIALQAYAKGVQIYQVQRSATDSTVFNWVLVGPSATLYANPNYTNQVGTHYAGPTWEFTKGFNKGQKTVAKKLQESPVDPTAIPWLLLQTIDASSSSGNKVTYVQRICTTGGLAPVTGADKEHLLQKDSIPYTAVYRFYKERNAGL